jgi:nucleotide-binding universal stress UspA family protein
MGPVSIRSVLVGSDLSAGSDAVVRAAAGLAEQTGAALHVVHAFEFLGVPLREATLHLGPLRTLVEQSRDLLRDQLARAVPETMERGTVKLDHRPASTALLERARAVGADVIVLGPHRPGLGGSDRQGGTVRRVLEEASVPCLVTRSPLPVPVRRVLLPVGRSDVRRGLLAAAVEWLAALRCRQEARAPTGRTTELRVFHAARLPGEWRAFSGELTDELRTLRDQPDLGDHLDLRPTITWGRSPAEEVVRAARERPTDLVALGVHEHAALMRGPPGDVSSAVLRAAAAPALLFPSLLCDVRAGMVAPRPPGPSGVARAARRRTDDEMEPPRTGPAL